MKSTKLTHSLPRLVAAFLSMTVFGIGTAHSCHFTDSGCDVDLVAGYSNKGSGSTFVTATTGFYTEASGSSYSSGYGVITSGETSATGYKMLDNNTNTDLLAFKFGSAVILDKITFGYTGSDADFSLFAWTGSTTATDSQVLSAINGKSVSNLATSSTWTLIGNYSAAAGATWDNQKEVNVNNNEIATNGVKSSSWWIISAYNSGYGGNNGGFDNGDDYMKILGVACLPSSGGGGQVSEPASLLLFGVAMMGVVGLRRRRQDLV